MTYELQYVSGVSLPRRPEGAIFVISYWLMPFKKRGAMLQHQTWSVILVLRTSNKWEVKYMWQEVIAQVRFHSGGLSPYLTSTWQPNATVQASFWCAFFSIFFFFLEAGNFYWDSDIRDQGWEGRVFFGRALWESGALLCPLGSHSKRFQSVRRILSVLKTEANLINEELQSPTWFDIREKLQASDWGEAHALQIGLSLQPIMGK